MTNLMSTIYIGYVVEIIKQNNKPTLDLRIRVPSIHGVSASTGIADIDLPIAKPLMMPGTKLDSNNFISFIESLNKVYVIFESGNYNNPVYLGVKTNSDLYDIPMDEVTNNWLDSFNIVNPQEDDILVYNKSSNKFENKQQSIVLPEFHYVGSEKPSKNIKIWIQIPTEEEPEPIDMMFNLLSIPIIEDNNLGTQDITIYKESPLSNTVSKFKLEDTNTTMVVAQKEEPVIAKTKLISPDIQTVQETITKQEPTASKTKLGSTDAKVVSVDDTKTRLSDTDTITALHNNQPKTRLSKTKLNEDSSSTKQVTAKRTRLAKKAKHNSLSTKTKLNKEEGSN